MAAEGSRRLIETEASVAAAEARASAVADRAGSASARVIELEAEIEALQAQAQRSSATIEEMEKMLRGERQSAVEAMELLTMVQERFLGKAPVAR